MSTACLASTARPVAPARAHAHRTRAASTANGGTRRFAARSRRRGDVTTSDAAASTASTTSSSASPFERLESLLSSAAEATAPSDARGWRELEGTWVLSPPDPGADPRAVVHFCGGAFVGASPQLTYRLFLERLCARANVTIVATPFAIGFEHLRIADDAQFAFDRALRALVAEDATRYANIPTFGVGHSMGALLHSIIGARYELANSTRRCGNALMSFNNKPATDAIPAFAEAVAPGMQALSPVLSAALNNPVSVFLVIFCYFLLFLVIFGYSRVGNYNDVVFFVYRREIFHEAPPTRSFDRPPSRPVSSGSFCRCWTRSSRCSWRLRTARWSLCRNRRIPRRS